MKSFYLAGLKYQIDYSHLDHLHSSDVLLALRENDNLVHANALAVYFNGAKLGYVPASMLEYLQSEIHKFGSVHLRILQYFPNRPTWKKIKVIPLFRKSH